MKLVIDLEEAWAYDESIADAIKEAVNDAIGKEIRRVVRDTVGKSRAAIIAVASSHAERMIAEADKALRGRSE